MVELIKAVKKSKPPKGDTKTLNFILKNHDQDLLAHIAIPLPHVDIEYLTPKNYEIKEIVLGKPTVENNKTFDHHMP